jgi:hypothetical protein
MKNWKQYITPTVIVGIILTLIGVVYNGIADDIKDNKKAIERKVDNSTLKMLIQQQNIVIKNQQEQNIRIYQELIKIRQRQGSNNTGPIRNFPHPRNPNNP